MRADLGRALVLSATLAACGEASSPESGRAETAVTLAGAPGSAQRDAPQPEAVTFAQLVGELGVQVDDGVPEAEAVALYQLMRRAGYEVKVIRSDAPGCCTLNAWGVIPHAAMEFTLRRDGSRWEVLRDESWVLIGAIREHA